MSKIGIAKAATTVRYGPSSTLYASVGSIDAEESVVVHGMENGWYCISYSAGKLLKRGFVPSGTFTDESELSTEAIISVGYSRTVKNAQTVYTGPIPANYATAGSVSAGEVVTAFTPTEDNYTYIEYGTSSGVKRGYIPTNQLTSAKGMLAYISAATTVYYGPSTDYVISGSLTAGEYCVIISRETPFGTSSKWCQVEYISGSSRKRGYVRQGTVVPYGSLSSLTIEAARKYLCGVVNSNTTVMENAVQSWSIRKVTYAKRITSLMESNGVSIQYSYDSLNGDDLEEDDAYKELFPDYPNYYLDYTTPI